MVVGEGELSGYRSGGLSPPFLGLALKLWTILGISHSGQKIGHDGKDTVPCCMSCVRGRGGGPLRGLLEPPWPFPGEGPTPHKEETGTGRGVLGMLSNLQSLGTSMVVQWLRIHLPMQGTRVRSLVGELSSRVPWGN